MSLILWLDWQRLRFLNWYCFDRAARDLSVRIKQDAWDTMPDDKWGAFLNSLSFAEFIQLMNAGLEEENEEEET